MELPCRRPPQAKLAVYLCATMGAEQGHEEINDDIDDREPEDTVTVNDTKLLPFFYNNRAAFVHLADHLFDDMPGRTTSPSDLEDFGGSRRPKLLQEKVERETLQFVSVQDWTWSKSQNMKNP